MKELKLTYIDMNTELFVQSSERPELVQRLQNGKAFVIYNKHMSDRFTVSMLHESEHTDMISDVQFSQDGKFIAATYSGTVVIYDLGTGEKVTSFRHDCDPYDSIDVVAVSFTPDAEHLLCALSTGKVTIWNVKSGADWTEDLGLGRGGLSMFSRDGSILVWSAPGLIRVFDCEVGSGSMIRLRTVIREADRTETVTISADNKFLACVLASTDTIIRFWSTETGTRIDNIPTDGTIFSLAFSTVGNKLVTQEGLATITLRDLPDRASSQHWSKIPVHSFRESERDYRNWKPVWSCDDKWILSGSDYGSITLWSVDGDPQFIMWAHDTKIGMISVGKGHSDNVGYCKVRTPLRAGGLVATWLGCQLRVWKYV